MAGPLPFHLRFWRPSLSYVSSASSYHVHHTSTPFSTAPRLRLGQYWQHRSYGRPAYQYQRYQQSRGYLRAWAANPHFFYHVSGIAGVIGGVYVYNLETVPVSGRRRFNIISPETEVSISASMYDEVLRQYAGQIYPPSSNEHRLVQRILNRLLPHSGLNAEGWAIHVVHDPYQPNAFVIPGGKVVVFSGLIDLCRKGNDVENELAIVLGHEIAHNVAHHAAERMSQQASVMIPLTILTTVVLGSDFGIGRLIGSLAFEKPGSRAQESEADYIGLLMAASSCYNPSAALQLWQRMEDFEKAQGGSPPQFLSTHPSNHNRMAKIRSWLPEAEAKRDENGCASIMPYARDFKQLTNISRW